jgi:hypothetical protein
MYIMLQIIIEHTYPHTPLEYAPTHTISVKTKMKRLEDASLRRGVFNGTLEYNISFYTPSLFFFYVSCSNTDLAQPELRVLYELVGTLNV